MTGSCPNCGANQFRFDEEQQTFVCEYCGATVYQGKTADHASKMKPKSEQPKVEPCTEQLHSNDSVDCSTKHQTYDFRQTQAFKFILAGFMYIGIGIIINDVLYTELVPVESLIADLFFRVMYYFMPIVGTLLIIWGGILAIINFIKRHK